MTVKEITTENIVKSEKDIDSQNIQNEKSEIKEAKKGPSKFKRFLGLSCLGIIVIVLLLLAGIAIGVYLYPKTLDWLANNKIGTLFGVTKDESGNSQSSVLPMPFVKREIVTEESAVINVVEKSKPSVVSIAIMDSSTNPENPNINQNSKIGTGFFVDSKGIIATNQHVVSRINANYVIITDDNNTYEVKKIVRDDVNDVALVSIEEGNYPSLVLGDSDLLKLGQMVVAIGTPLGEFPGSVTTGIISGLHRNVSTTYFGTTSKKYDDVIQTDTAINSGNSGGPLLDLSGNVIGINFAKTNADNISFALPVSVLKSRLSEFKTLGKFLTPFLGVEYQTITQTDASFYKNVVPGAYILKVYPSSPAEQAGIKKGDVITTIGGKDATLGLARIIQDRKIGEKVKLEVYRDGKKFSLEVVLQEKAN